MIKKTFDIWCVWNIRKNTANFLINRTILHWFQRKKSFKIDLTPQFQRFLEDHIDLAASYPGKDFPQLSKDVNQVREATSGLESQQNQRRSTPSPLWFCRLGKRDNGYRKTWNNNKCNVYTYRLKTRKQAEAELRRVQLQLRLRLRLNVFRFNDKYIDKLKIVKKKYYQ